MAKSDEKHKHLEFIENITARMGQNSFMIKAWTIALVSAAFALVAKENNHIFALVAAFPTIIFWLLDSYYLHQERLFIRLYCEVIEKATVDYSLSTSRFDKGWKDFFGSAFSKTIWPFYLGIISTLVLVIAFVK